MSDAEDAAPSLRAGSGADLARRMDRMETRQDGIEQEVRTLAATVARVEQNQNHAEELHRLRFDSLSAAIGNIGTTLATYITRVEKSEMEHATAVAKRQGMVVALTGGRALLLTLAAVAGPIVAIFIALTR